MNSGWPRCQNGSVSLHVYLKLPWSYLRQSHLCIAFFQIAERFVSYFLSSYLVMGFIIIFNNSLGTKMIYVHFMMWLSLVHYWMIYWRRSIIDKQCFTCFFLKVFVRINVLCCDGRQTAYTPTHFNCNFCHIKCSNCTSTKIYKSDFRIDLNSSSYYMKNYNTLYNTQKLKRLYENTYLSRFVNTL